MNVSILGGDARGVGVQQMYRRHIRARWRLYARWTRQFVLHNILHADDPPHRLALGIAIGVWVTFTPTIGAQMLLVVAFAWLLKANKIVGVAATWISNPLTFMAVFWPSYWVGAQLLDRDLVDEEFWTNLLDPPPGWIEGTVFYWGSFMEIAGPLWLGSLIVGTPIAAISYFVCYRLICAYRVRRWGGLVPPTMALVPRTDESAPSNEKPEGKARPIRSSPPGKPMAQQVTPVPSTGTTGPPGRHMR